MKTKFLVQVFLLITLATAFSITKLLAQVTESESNDLPALADSVPLNGGGSGSLSYAGDEDWWKVKTNADGDLTVLLSGAPILRTVIIYDTAGTILLTQANVGNDIAGPTATGLAPATYFIKIKTYYGWETGGSYTVSVSLAAAALNNDKEPNNNSANAARLVLNGSGTGHIGYYYNNKRDSADWYKVSTNGDGKLYLSLNNTGNQNLISLLLYDNDGTTLLNNAAVGNGIGGLSTDGLAAGTYYICIKDYYGASAFGPYTISNTLTKPVLANDKEPNNKRAEAQKLLVNSSTTGHYGYYYNQQRDSADWYKLTTTEDGMIKLTLDNTGNTLASIQLFDNDGATILNGTNIGGGIGEFYTDGLAAGTYYIKVRDYYSNIGFGPYRLTDSLITYKYATDKEPNNRPFRANNIIIDSTIDGHINFYYNNKVDSSDWYLLTYNNNTQKLDITIKIQPSLINNILHGMVAEVYTDTLKAPILTQALSAAVNKFKVPKGKYYIKFYAANPSDGYSAYSIKTSIPVTGFASEETQNISKVIPANFNWTISGNAAANNCAIQLQLNADAHVSVNVTSITGNLITSIQKGRLQKGKYTIPLNFNNTNAGLYVLNLLVDNTSESKKIIK